MTVYAMHEKPPLPKRRRSVSYKNTDDAPTDNRFSKSDKRHPDGTQERYIQRIDKRDDDLHTDAVGLDEVAGVQEIVRNAQIEARVRIEGGIFREKELVQHQKKRRQQKRETSPEINSPAQALHG